VNRLLQTLLYCIIPNVVYATPSARDAYNDSSEIDSSDLIFYLCIFAAAWVLGKIFNKPVGEILTWAVIAFMAYILFMFGCVTIQAFIKYPFAIGCLLLFWWWLHCQDKKRNNRK
jgi:hypothetical protein